MTKKKGLLQSPNGSSYLVPFILVTSLFLLWGIAHSILDVLNKHFQDIIGVSKGQSGFIQFALFMGYFVMAIPGGMFLKRFGYKKGIIFGLALFALGAFLFYPAAAWGLYFPFLVALFILGCGSALLENAANPYSGALGPSEQSANRINFSHSFNGLGQVIGPIMGAMLIFGVHDVSETEKFNSLLRPYMYIGIAVTVVAIAFLFTKMPDIREGNKTDEKESAKVPFSALFKQKFLIMAIVAQFLYVAAQTGINSFFINYVIEEFDNILGIVQSFMGNLGYFGKVLMPQVPEQAAALMLSLGGLTLFLIGRVVGTYLMKYFAPEKMLLIYAIVNTVLLSLVAMSLGAISVFALFACYFFMSIMFPTIFALGIKGLGPLTKNGSSLIVMAIVGAALCPPFMGTIADHFGMAVGFIVPVVCFAYIAIFSFVGVKRFATKKVAINE